MSAALRKDDDPARELSADDKIILREAAELLRAQSRVALACADALDAAHTVSDAMAVEQKYTEQIDALGEKHD